METNNKLIELTEKYATHVTELAKKTAEVSEKYNKRMFILCITLLVSSVVVLCTFGYCYFSASYGENYQQHITQEVNTTMDNGGFYDYENIELD